MVREATDFPLFHLPVLGTTDSGNCIENTPRTTLTDGP